MRLRVLYVIVFMLSAVSGFAANIKGIIEDGNTKEPVGYATVVLSDSLKQRKDMSAIAAEDGSFSFAGVKPGSYILKVSFVGYKELVQPIGVPKDNSIINLRKLSLKPTANALDEVSVVGQKAQMRFEIDRKVFDVNQNIAAEGASASDALRNIPSVAVDQDGNLSLRNNSSVDLWINGKPSGLTGDARAQFLEQLPAESIQSIEVVTNPGAKYSAEGTAGAINLVLKKDRKSGNFGGVTLSADTKGSAMAFGNFNHTSSKVDFGLNGGFGYWRSSFGNNIFRQSWQGNDTTVLNQYNDSKYNGLGVMLRANVTYHITDNDDIQFTGGGMYGLPKDKASLVSSDGNGVITRDRNADDDGRFNFYYATVDYSHKFSDGHNLRVYANYNNFGNDMTQRYTQTAMNVFSAQRQESNGSMNRGDLQLDYSNQINKLFKIESGYSGNVEVGHSDVFTEQGPDLQQMLPVPSLNNNFKLSSTKHALYATFSGKIKKFGFQAGLRGEYMHYTAESRPYSLQSPDVTRNIWHLYPSVFLTYSLPKNNELQLNYTNRVSYPGGMQLNSFRQITDSTTISYGNPSLLPEYSQALEFNYIKNWDAHTLSASVYYRFTDGVIQQVSYYEAPVMYYTFENVTRLQSVGVEMIAKNKLWKILDLTTTLNLYYQKQNPFDFVYVDNKGVTNSTYYKGTSDFTWTLRVMASIILPKEFMVQATGEYNAEQVLVQGRTLPSYAMDLGVRKSFMNKKLSVSISGRNILNSRSMTRETYGDNFYQYQKHKFDSWRLRFSVSYNFGKGLKGKEMQQQQQQEILNSGGGMMGI